MYMYVPCVDVHVHTKGFCLVGACIGERDTYQRVHVDDGSAAMGIMDHLVHQTVSLSLSL